MLHRTRACVSIITLCAYSLRSMVLVVDFGAKNRETEAASKRNERTADKKKTCLGERRSRQKNCSKKYAHHEKKNSYIKKNSKKFAHENSESSIPYDWERIIFGRIGCSLLLQRPGDSSSSVELSAGSLIFHLVCSNGPMCVFGSHLHSNHMSAIARFS